MDCEPLTALVPDHAPDAVQLVAFAADHVSIEAAPEFTVLGLALKVTTGARADTVTVAVCVAKPPGPRQVTSYSVVAARAPVDQVPLVATPPLQPPEDQHTVALVACHCKVVLSPSATVDGEAVIVTVGAATPEFQPPKRVQVAELPTLGCVPSAAPEGSQPRTLLSIEAAAPTVVEAAVLAEVVLAAAVPAEVVPADVVPAEVALLSTAWLTPWPSDNPHAESAVSAAQASNPRSPRRAAIALNPPLSEPSRASLPALERMLDFRFVLRACEFITPLYSLASPSMLAPQSISEPWDPYSRARMINGFFSSANLSPFAYVSVICGRDGFVKNSKKIF